MMISNSIFQVDNHLVRNAYNNKNYTIRYDESVPAGTCAIYFSSNNIYHPNNEVEFSKKIIDNDFYEWFKIRIKKVHKHIFLRDIHKQWYITGISSEINSPEKLLEFLQAEIKGCKVTVVGSSAGGYAAVLYGSLIKAEKIFSFNGQMELNSLLDTSTPQTDPLLFRLQNKEVRRFYDLKPFISNASKIFYFYSSKSDWDKQQAIHISNLPINIIAFSTAHHGIPFLKCSLIDVLNYSNNELIQFSKNKHNPLLFSIRCSGILRVSKFVRQLIINTLSEKYRSS